MMSFTVSLDQHGNWQPWAKPGAIFVRTVAAPSKDRAIELVKWQWDNEQRTRFALPITAGIVNWSYCIPPAGTLAPYGLKVGRAMGTKFYIGAACAHHPLNHLRRTHSKRCVICEAWQSKNREVL